LFLGQRQEESGYQLETENRPMFLNDDWASSAPFSQTLTAHECVPPLKSSRYKQEVWWTGTHRFLMLLSKS